MKIKKTKMNDAADIDEAAFPIANEREPELEAILGEIIVADFQTHRLRNVLSDKAAGYIHAGGGYYRKNQKNSSTTNTFSHKGRLYRISISVQEVKF
ncbi:MAG TPA: hypothetical protein VF172_01290 [Nitrososphaera sp.]